MTNLFESIFRPKAFLLLLALLLLAAFPKVLTLQETFFYRDFSTFAYPLAFYHRDCFWRGEVPLWNPLNNCGLPFLAQWNTMTLYPLSLFYLLFPLSWSLGVFCVGHLFLGGAGMYFLAQRWTRFPFAAAVASVAFTFNGLTINSLMWTNNIAVIGWMPWVLLATERAWQKGGISLALAGLVGAVQMLAGGPEMIVFTWILLGLLCFGDCLQRSSPRWLLVRRFLTIVLLVAALSAIQLLPFLELLGRSQRDQSFGGSDWSMPGWGWANLLVPAFFNFPASQGVFYQYGQYWTSSYYLGIGILSLALLAPCVVKELKVRLLAMIFFASFILALGTHTPLYGWLEQMIPLGFMRYPIKLVTLAVFVAPLLAAFSVRYLFSPEAPQPARHWIPAWAVGAVLLILIGAIVWFAVHYPQYPAPYDQWEATWKSGSSRAIFLLVMGGLAYASAHFQQIKAQIGCRLALVLVLWLDLLTHAPQQNPTVPRWVYQPDIVRAKSELPLPVAGQARAISSPVAERQFDASRGGNPTFDVLQKRLILLHNCNILDRVPKVNGFYSLYPKANAELISLFYSGQSGELTGLANFLSVSVAGNPADPLGWTPRSSFLPLVTAGQAAVFADDREVLQRLAQADFNANELVYLPLEAKSAIPINKRSNAKIVSSQFADRQVAFTVSAETNSWVVISQSYDPSWKASIAGRPAHLWRANHAFQALAVPAGDHEVKLTYQNRFFQCGLLVSGAAFIGCLTLFGFSNWPVGKLVPRKTNTVTPVH